MGRDGLVDVVFSWTIHDILNHNLLKTKVEKIPKAFISVEHYLNTFSYPLLEETHADVNSSMKALHQAPVCEISRILDIKDGKNQMTTIYNVFFQQEEEEEGGKKEKYKPQTGDLILLSDTRHVRIDNLKRSRRPITLAIVVSNGKIRASKVVAQQMRYTVYAFFLMNLTTNTRIWEALKQGADRKNMDIVRNVLNAGSTVGIGCDLCSSQEVENMIGRELYADLLSYNLNESQTDAVLSSILTSKCNHKNSVKLVWGPPGTGKTKTVASLLWALLNLKCRTLVCAPTNIAVVEVVLRLLKLVRERESNRPNCHMLGDVVLFGNEVRMRVEEYDELSNVFLDHRVVKLEDSFSKWTVLLDSMINLLKYPTSQYNMYQENMRKEEEKEQESDGTETRETSSQDNISKSSQDNISESEIRIGEIDDVDQNKRNRKGKTSDNILTFGEYFSRKFNQVKENLSFCISTLCANVPSSCISGAAHDMNKALDSLESIETLLQNDTVSDEEMTKIFASYKETSSTDEGSSSSLGMLSSQRIECLKILISLRKFSVPEFSDSSSISDFCLQNASLIFCTASGSCNIKVEEMKPLKMLVVDEAAQLKECELLIPLQLPGIQHAILIGDDRQLPATIKSKISEEAGLGRSLFERLVSLGHRKHLLDTQYRMHPSISSFPNTKFYSGQIMNGANVRERSYKRNLLEGDMYGPYSFINVGYGNDMSNNKHSQKNLVEVAVVSRIVANLYKASAATGERVSVGVISPYKGQVFAIQEKLGDKYEGNSSFSVSVRSVDGFQGGEEDVIIISTVRSNEKGSVGFLTNLQRTNVALTRARYCLWILGNVPTLTYNDSIWKDLVENAKNRRCYFEADEDKRLVEAIVDGMVESEQLEDLLNIKSPLFKAARWKVSFAEDFLISLKKVRNVETQKEVTSLLKKLSDGWRDTEKERDLSVTDGTSGTSSQLLKCYEIDKKLVLVWAVDVVKENSKYIQVLKFCEISTLTERPTLSLNLLFRRYTAEDIHRCKYKCLEGNLEVPMSWEISPEEDHLSASKSLSTRFASLNLK